MHQFSLGLLVAFRNNNFILRINKNIVDPILRAVAGGIKTEASSPKQCGNSLVESPDVYKRQAIRCLRFRYYSYIFVHIF